MHKRLLKSLDYPLLISTIALLIFSLITIGSATFEYVGSSPLNPEKIQEMNIFLRILHLDYSYVVKQAVWILLGLFAAMVLLYVDYEDIAKYSTHLYIFNLVMLVAVIFMGTTSLGAQRWIDIGPFSFQPSEFSKLIIIITFADFLTKRQGKLNTFWQLAPCFVYIGIPVLLILGQPDLGTSMVFIAMMFGMLFVAGGRPSILLGIIVFGLIMAFSIYEVHEIVHKADIELKDKISVVNKAIDGDDYELNKNKALMEEIRSKGFSLDAGGLNRYLEQTNAEHSKKQYRHNLFHKVTLKEYQMTRLTIFVNPESDLLGAGYHVWQSRIAIGSGGLTGKGLLRGTQSHYTFLPIRHTDFIFSVVGEEFGFIGVTLLLSLFYTLLYRGVKIITTARDTYGMLLAAGVVSMFTFHIFLNIGMTSGIMPVTGIPLPLFSYGGSNIIMNLACIGLLMNVYVRRAKLVF